MVRPSVVVLRRGEHSESFRSLFIEDRIPEVLRAAVDEHGFDCDPAALHQSEWTFQPAGQTHLFGKLMHAGRPLAEVLEGQLFYGIKTGLNDAFIIDQCTRDRLVDLDPACTQLLKQLVRGEDLRPWYQENEGRWLIVMPNGWTRKAFRTGANEARAWAVLRERHPSIADHLAPFAAAARKRTDQGEFWWELRSCDYYSAFEGPKIFWPDIAKLPRFSWDEHGKYINDKGYIVPTTDWALLGILQSRVSWFAVSHMCVPLRLRAGLWQYQMKSQFISRLPIPSAPPAESKAMGALAMQITKHVRDRYALHQRVRHRIATDLDTASRGLNKKLTAWWGLDFPTFRAEVKKALRQEIPLRDRDDWQAWLSDGRAEHQQHTTEIVRLETELNARVYELFDLSPAEIQIIEESTKYRYGEV
jgi:hypothetical protein